VTAIPRSPPCARYGRGGGLIDAPGGWLVGPKGENPHCPLYLLSRTRDFVFEIGGYDPRDLLRGHYLQFVLHANSLPVREPCDDDVSDLCCVCLTRVEGETLSRTERACATARATCDGVLPIRSLAQVQRYYVPEQRAAELEQRLREAMQRRTADAVVAIDAEGDANVRELRIDGEPIPGGVAR
jgi:hypothetical protein